MSAALLKVQVKVSGVVSADVVEVWEHIRNFGRAEVWSGFYKGAKVVTALLPGQVEGQIGSVRTTAIGAASYVEQLDALDNDSYVMKYKIVDHPSNTNPFPGSLFDFRATIKLMEVTRGPATFMEWRGEFETAPQEYAVMHQAVADLFEAGFLGLEQRIATVPGFGPVESATLPRPMHAHNLSDISRNLGSMNLRPTGPHVIGLEAASGASSFQHAPERSYMGPASVVSEPVPPQLLQNVNESASASSLESSPHIPDRPPGGFHHQWTSGGSGQRPPHLPKRLSADQEAVGHRAIHRGRSTVRDEMQDPRTADAQSRQRLRGHVGSSRYSASSMESVPHYQPDPVHRTIQEDLSLGSTVSEAHTADTSQAQDPVLQDREAFRNSLLKNNLTSINSLRTADKVRRRTSDRESSKSQSTERREDPRAMPPENPAYSIPGSELPSPQNPNDDSFDNLEWARSKQQREIEAREAFQRKAGRLGPFSQAATPGGPFAAASNAAARTLPRHASQHSLGSIDELTPSMDGGTRNTTPKHGQDAQPPESWISH